MASRALVLDANILIRGVLGNRVRRILEKYADSASFFIPESAYAEAEEHLAALVTKRGGDAARGHIMLRAVIALGDLVTTDLYGGYEAEARKRLGARDPEDWPILASSLALGCPIWTEDYRLLWMRRCDLDFQSRRDFLGRLAAFDTGSEVVSGRRSVVTKGLAIGFEVQW
jgi:predicted nucleic acid-binding protein